MRARLPEPRIGIISTNGAISVLRGRKILFPGGVAPTAHRTANSPATCRRDQIRRAARWLREVGIQVPEKNGEPDATIEISPLFATSETQLKERNVKAITPPSNRPSNATSVPKA
jgi:hypothetical protein